MSEKIFTPSAIVQAASIVLSILMLLAGDVETNPGPIKFSLYCVQQACVFISTHVPSWFLLTGRGLSVSETEWLCPTCLISELPYANNRLVSEASLNLANTSDSSLRPNVSPLTECIATPILMYKASCRRWINLLLNDTKRPAIVDVSETWLNSSVQDSEVSIPSFELYRRQSVSVCT